MKSERRILKDNNKKRKQRKHSKKQPIYPLSMPYLLTSVRIRSNHLLFPTCFQNSFREQLTQ